MKALLQQKVEFWFLLKKFWFLSVKIREKMSGLYSTDLPTTKGNSRRSLAASQIRFRKTLEATIPPTLLLDGRKAMPLQAVAEPKQKFEEIRSGQFQVSVSCLILSGLVLLCIVTKAARHVCMYGCTSCTAVIKVSVLVLGAICVANLLVVC